MINSEDIIYSTKIRNARQIQKFLARKKIWNCQQKSKKNYGRHPLQLRLLDMIGIFLLERPTPPIPSKWGMDLGYCTYLNLLSLPNLARSFILFSKQADRCWATEAVKSR
jgi:hypothetical protein